MSRSDNGRRPRNAAFDIVVFVRQVVTDLRDALGSDADILLASSSNPVAFRSCIGGMLSEADCMDNTYRYAALRQVEACVSKLPTWGAASASRRQSSALEKFLDAEKRCRRVNKRIRHYRLYPGRLPLLVEKVINGAQLELFRALGDVPEDDLLWEGCSFGPGTTFGFDHADFSIHRKVFGEQTVTPGCRQLALKVLLTQFPNWARFLGSDESNILTVVKGNRISFVPKSASIDRTIGIEPSLNVFLQKGIDEFLKVRARRLGVRITDQDYSIDCLRKQGLRVSTIDLSSASDSIAHETVRWLFPGDWFELLDAVRSHNYTLDKGKTWSSYEKFSSMGNATTFPVESMLFAALARSACKVAGYADEIESCVRVYGDDIIVPWECAALLIEVLAFLGFNTNTDKTFVFGPFRETCGADLLGGVDVRPVYLRAIPTRPWHIAGLHNRLLANRYGFAFHCTLSYLLSLVEKPLLGPAYLGNSLLDAGVQETFLGHGYRSSTWGDWYAGRNTDGDSYFWSPTPYWSPVVIHHGDTPHVLHAVKAWRVVRKIRKDHGYSEAACYQAFLLGVSGGKPVGDVVVVEAETVFHGTWPDPIYNYPAVHAVPRKPTDRIIRQLTRWVFGEP